MDFFDRLTIDAKGIRRTGDGYLAATVLAARTGIQEYRADEVGKAGTSMFKVYRPPDEVFSKDAMSSFAWRPVTIEHPRERVTADNWKKYSVGLVGDEVARDGEAIRVPLILMDAEAITAVEAGKREISMGYSCDLKWGEGVTPEGLKYDAIQHNIRANHLAVVDTARGGPTLRIGDEEMSEALRKILVDGLQVETTDAGVAAIEKLQKDIAKLTADMGTSAAALTAANAAHATAIGAKDAEIADLKTKIVTEDKIDALAAAKAAVVADAKIVLPDLKTDGMPTAEIKKAVVKAKLGDGVPADAAPQYFDGAFATIVAGAKAGGGQQQGNSRGGNIVADALSRGGGQPPDADKAWQDSVKADENAWRPKAVA